MNKKDPIIKVISEQGLVPLYFHPDPDTSVEIMKALYAAGVRVIEYTNRGQEAMDNLEILKRVAKKDCKGLLLAMGTVMDGEAAEKALHAGADFLISPGYSKEVLAVAHHHERLWIPGCMTPSELMRASHAGIKMVKLFPGNLLGPGFVSSVKELFPELLFMPTGGVEPEEGNLKAWFGAGVSAVGIGSKLITKSLIQQKSFAELTTQTAKLIDHIKAIRKP